MRRFLLYAAALPVLLSAMLTAQVIQDRSARVEGVVRDTSGAPLPGVTLELSCDALIEKTRSVVSDGDGKYTMIDLPAGECTMHVSLPGFQSATWRGKIGSATNLPFAMRVGALEEAITVSGVSQERSPGRRRFNTEAYDKIDENPWMAVNRRPLSTFSVDVDTASYANVRRYLNERELPPKDAVRIEELINYFSYDYAPPDNRMPFSVSTAYGEAPWNRRHRLALIGLQARHLDMANVPRRNLVFLIDVSGSMNAPEKLPLVKESLIMLARNLTSDDRIAIAVYAGAAGLVLPSTSGADTAAVLDALTRLEAGGSTNGAEGIELAYQVAQEQFIKGGVNRVVLATDGDFNVGVTSQGDLNRLIEKQREKGIALSVLGFGMGNLKDSTMEKLADRGNGNYAYIDSPREAQKVLVEQAAGTLVTVAKDVKLQVEFNPRTVAAYRLIGYENRVLEDRDFNDDAKDAGDIGLGHSVTALYELVPVGENIDMPGVDPLKYQRTAAPSKAADRDEVLTVKLRYKLPDARKSSALSVVLANRPDNVEALDFPAAVTEFGMLLRDSEHKGSASFRDALALATRSKGADDYGHRAEFIELLGVAAGLSREPAADRSR